MTTKAVFAIATAAVAALAGAGQGGASFGAAAPQSPPLRTRTFTASSQLVANPDRGLFHYTETHARTDGSGNAPLDAATAAWWRATEGITLVYRVYYLERFTDTDDLDPGYLAQVRADFTAARSAGVKLIVRFAYSADSGRDAPVARVVSHIKQLAPVLNENADVLAVLQAGFIGQWGEWYYSDAFTTDRQRPWLLTDSDWQKRGEVLQALLDATTPSVFVQVRYPGIKQRLVSDAPNAARVGIHDDCFLAGTDDYGTFATGSDHDWLRVQTRTVPMGGETCAVNVPRSGWPSASAELRAYHWTYLNADFQPDVLRSWGGGLEEVRRRLGYRLRLVRASVSTTAVVNTTVKVQLSLANDGYAAPFRARPVRLVLRGVPGDFVTSLPVDLRTLAPGTARTISLAVPAPSQPGQYAAYLALADPAPGLANTPAYSIRLANVGTWDSRTGWNNLGARIRVTP